MAGWALAATVVFGQGSAEESDAFRRSLKPQGHVSDWAEVFSSEQKAELEARLEGFRRTNGAELAVVALKSLKGGQIDDFANKLFAEWGIGEKGKDNGVLLLAAIEDRTLRIEVGYGLEGVLTDAGTGRIQDEYVVPRFKEGNAAQGLIDGATALLAAMSGESLPEEPAAAAAAADGNPIVGVFVLLLFAVVFILIARAAAKGNRMGGGGNSGGSRSGGGSSSGGGGFGGFGGGSSGGGGSSRGW